MNPDDISELVQRFRWSLRDSICQSEADELCNSIAIHAKAIMSENLSRLSLNPNPTTVQQLREWHNLGLLVVAIANGNALMTSAEVVDDNPANCISAIMRERDSERARRIYYQDALYALLFRPSKDTKAQPQQP